MVIRFYAFKVHKYNVSLAYREPFCSELAKALKPDGVVYILMCKENVFFLIKVGFSFFGRSI